MTRWIGVLSLNCLALPVLFAKEPDVDKVAKDSLRAFSAFEDELDALLKNPPKTPAEAAAKDKILSEKLDKINKEFLSKVKGLSPEDHNLLADKFGNEIAKLTGRIDEKLLKAARVLGKDDPKTAPKKDGPKPESPDEIAKRINENSDKAVERLNKTDTGKDTQENQDKVSEYLKKLLEQNDPDGGGGGGGGGGGAQGNNGGAQGNSGAAQGNNGGNQGAIGGNGKDPKDPMGNGSKGGKDPKDGQKGNGGGGKPDNKGGKEGGGMGGKGSDVKTKNPDIKIGEWGNFPERQRQELDAYAREQFMRRYEEQLRQYYRAIAEQSRGDR